MRKELLKIEGGPRRVYETDPSSRHARLEQRKFPPRESDRQVPLYKAGGKTNAPPKKQRDTVEPFSEEYIRKMKNEFGPFIEFQDALDELNDIVGAGNVKTIYEEIEKLVSKKYRDIENKLISRYGMYHRVISDVKLKEKLVHGAQMTFLVTLTPLILEGGELTDTDRDDLKEAERLQDEAFGIRKRMQKKRTDNEWGRVAELDDQARTLIEKVKVRRRENRMRHLRRALKSVPRIVDIYLDDFTRLVARARASNRETGETPASPDKALKIAVLAYWIPTYTIDELQMRFARAYGTFPHKDQVIDEVLENRVRPYTPEEFVARRAYTEGHNRADDGFSIHLKWSLLPGLVAGALQWVTVGALSGAGWGLLVVAIGMLIALAVRTLRRMRLEAQKKHWQPYWTSGEKLRRPNREKIPEADLENRAALAALFLELHTAFNTFLEGARNNPDINKQTFEYFVELQARIWTLYLKIQESIEHGTPMPPKKEINEIIDEVKLAMLIKKSAETPPEHREAAE